MGERGFAIKGDLHKEAWENEEFPVLCETCLGDNPYVRMMKEAYGKACKICEKPFTVFRWKPGRTGRYKKTEICQCCAKVKNVCQTCVLDLQYCLPVQVRDNFLAQEDKMVVPQSDANREWYMQQHLKQIENGELSGYGKALTNKALMSLARTEPYYHRNRAHLCTFYARGECNRGDTCPYLHEMPRDKKDPMRKQNIKDRYYGKNDPVAKKILNAYNKKNAPPPPPPPPLSSSSGASSSTAVSARVVPPPPPPQVAAKASE